jgi:phosphatidylserine/phosphatidylglycerophosphate/cardiolipin synthase-like enzyme
MLEDLIFSMQGKFRSDQFQLFNDLYRYKTMHPVFSEFYNDWLKLAYCKQPFHMQIQRNILWRIDHAQKHIKIIAPYYYPIESLNRALFNARMRGVKVEIVTSVDRDIPAYREFSNSLLFNKLLLQGVEVYEYGHHYLHAKGILVDDEYLSVGSFNMDRWSWWNNVEAMIEIVNRKNELDQFKNIYSELKSKSYPVPCKENVEKEKRFMIRGWKLFHFLCDKLMNRGVYSYFQNSEGSLLEQMQTNMSWNYEKYRRISELDGLSVEDCLRQNSKSLEQNQREGNGN